MTEDDSLVSEGKPSPPDDRAATSLDPRNVLAAALGVCAFGLTFVFGFFTLGLGQLLVMMVCLPALLAAKSRRRKWVWGGGVLGGLAFTAYGLAVRALSHP